MLDEEKEQHVVPEDNPQTMRSSAKKKRRQGTGYMHQKNGLSVTASLEKNFSLLNYLLGASTRTDTSLHVLQLILFWF